MQQVASTAMSLRTVMSTDINLLPVKRQAFDVGIDDVGLEVCSVVLAAAVATAEKRLQATAG
ncbi:hypothetical protein OsJ_05901 [Oryza sativa Japonica Group]|uniref:Uncharacterized protein n=1 Tax=Oryza sativa subsp. japonica TaxID=39947 RepID=A3A4K7_ORYSJ|nr:hypothetical protein OsJ_05901 [Oryza sativa Japonica Group]